MQQIILNELNGGNNMAQANGKPHAKWYVCRDIDGTLTVSVSTANKTTKRVMEEVREATKHLRRGLG